MFDIEIVNGSSKRRRKYDDQVQLDTLEVANLRIRNPADTFDYDVVPAAITADRQLTLPLITGADTLASLGLAQTFTAAQTFQDDGLKIENPAATYEYTLTGAAIAADRQLNLPLITATDTLASLGLAQTFSPAQTFSEVIASAKGISFPATQVASADANTLDDYEEGTWTPAITFGGGSTGITYSTRVGGYVKIGKWAFIRAYILLSNKGSSTGTALVTALPFTVFATNGYSAPALRLTSITFANAFMGYLEPNATQMSLEEVTEAGSMTVLANTDFSNTSSIILSACYETTA